MGASYRSRQIAWEHPDGGFVFSHCGAYSIVPMPVQAKKPERYELWCNEVFITSRKTIAQCKDDADIFSTGKLKKVNQ